MDWIPKKEYLCKPAVPLWIYNSVNPHDCEFETTIRAVEKALGFNLFVWQKTYIQCGEFRQMGATTAEILKDLLNIKAPPIDYTRPPTSERERFYRVELKKIKTTLNDAGIPTRMVFFSERDKHAYIPPMFW